MPATVRTISLSVTIAETELIEVFSARGEVAADSGWPSCSVFVKEYPHVNNDPDDDPLDEEQPITVVAGAGNDVTRFTGRIRRFRPSPFPKSIEIVASGTLAYAAEWSPSEDLLFDEQWPSGATDQQLVAWALGFVPGVSYVGANIGGTGITLGTEAPEAFDWKAGTSAWSYVQNLDRATLYRTYQARDGTIYRVKMIGHPDNTEDFTLANQDILDGSSAGRDTEQTRNYVRVVGHDYGDGLGPVTAEVAGSNSFQDDGTDPATRHVEEFQSELIESGVDPDDGTWDGNAGLRADDIADQVIADVNKEFVEASVSSWRDDTHGPGLTCLLDAFDRLHVNEPMWVARHAWEVGDGGWVATYGLTGGGLPQDYTPPPV